MVYRDIRMQYLWQNDNILLQKQTFSHIFTMYFMAPCACIRKERLLYEHMHYILTKIIQ